MKPTPRNVRIDPLLTNISVAYKNADYIAEQILPVIPTKKVTGKYYVYDKSSLRPVKSLRGMGAPAREVGYGVSISTPFVCKDHALKELVPDELKDQAETPMNPEVDAAENVTEKLLVEKEKALADYMSSESNLTNYTTLSGTSQWSDFENSDPINDIETGVESVRSKILRPANTLVLGQQTWNKLKHHPDLIERIKYSGFGKMSLKALADLLDLDNVIVGSAGYVSTREGQTETLSYLWGKYAWLLYVTRRPGVKEVSFGYHFNYKKTADKWYDTDREGVFVRVHDFYTREIVTVSAAYFIKNAVA